MINLRLSLWPEACEIPRKLWFFYWSLLLFKPLQREPEPGLALDVFWPLKSNRPCLDCVGNIYIVSGGRKYSYIFSRVWFFSVCFCCLHLRVSAVCEAHKTTSYSFHCHHILLSTAETHYLGNSTSSKRWEYRRAFADGTSSQRLPRPMSHRKKSWGLCLGLGVFHLVDIVGAGLQGCFLLKYMVWASWLLLPDLKSIDWTGEIVRGLGS